MIDLPVLRREILWVLENYGSDAEEFRNPGSKRRAQADRIVEFVRQYQDAQILLQANKYDLLRVERLVERFETCGND